MIQLSWRRLAVVAVPLAFAAWAAPARAQNDTTRTAPRPLVTGAAAPDTSRNARRRAAEADTAFPRYRISPKGAFLRSLVLPGWGQSSIGAPGRGAVYFALESGSLWMVYTSNRKLSEAKRLQAAMREEGLIAPDADFGLVHSRRNQREDWITLSVFWYFFAGADAFVSAYLRDFDTHVRAAPGINGGTELQLSVPVGK